MKKILVPIDYSEVSINAFKYALRFNEQYNASIFLLHVFDMPLLTEHEEVAPYENYDSYRQQHKDKLQQLISQYKQNYNYEFEVFTTAGGHYIEIQDFVLRHSVDLVIIGNKGMGGMKRWFFGSVAKYLLTHARTPVISVPVTATFSPFKSILLVIDKYDFLTDFNIDFLKQVCEQFKATLKIGLIEKAEETNEKYEKNFLNWLDVTLNVVPTIIPLKNDNNIVEEINGLVQKVQSDLIVTVPHPHTWIDILLLGKLQDNIPVICEKPIMTLPITSGDEAE